MMGGINQETLYVVSVYKHRREAAPLWIYSEEDPEQQCKRRNCIKTENNEFQGS